MAKKKNKQNKEVEAPKSALVESQAEPEAEAPEELASEPEAPVAVAVDAGWNVHDAARQMIQGYRENWWASIRKMADAEALGETASEDACRALFKKWGALLK